MKCSPITFALFTTMKGNLQLRIQNYGTQKMSIWNKGFYVLVHTKKSMGSKSNIPLDPLTEKNRHFLNILLMCVTKMKSCRFGTTLIDNTIFLFLWWTIHLRTWCCTSIQNTTYSVLQLDSRKTMGENPLFSTLHCSGSAMTVNVCTCCECVTEEREY